MNAKKSLNILFVIPGGVHPSKVEKVIPGVVALLESLAQNNRVTVITSHQFPEPGSFSVGTIVVYNLGQLKGWKRIAEISLWVRAIRSVIKKQNAPFDIVHTFFLGKLSACAALAAWSCSVPAVCSVGGGEFIALYDIDYGGLRSWKNRLFLNITLRIARKVTVGSEYLANMCQSRHKDIRTIPLFPDQKYFHPILVSKASSKPYRLLTVSSINQIKDPFTLLKAFALVHQIKPECRLTWVGMDVLNGEAQKYAEMLGLSDHVIFHGPCPYDKLHSFFENADIYVQASRFESQGVAVCEAALHGLAVVGTNVGMLADLAKMDETAAQAVEIKSPEALAEGIRSVLIDKDLFRTLSENAARWARCRSHQYTAELFYALYSESIGERFI